MAKTQSSRMNSQLDENIKEQSLYQEIEHLRMTNQALWSLLVELSKKMQVSSAAIKTSVSSLLGYDIILDVSTQHELLEIIENSTDQVSKHVMLLTLVSKIEADTFALNPEPIEIPEVLSFVNRKVNKIYPEVSLDLSIHASGKPACIDYEYLSIALVMLFELFLETQVFPQGFNILATESQNHWHVDIKEISADMQRMLLKVFSHEASEFLQNVCLRPTRKLQLYVIRKIFELLSIQISTSLEEALGIRMMIPLVKRSC